MSSLWPKLLLVLLLINISILDYAFIRRWMSQPAPDPKSDPISSCRQIIDDQIGQLDQKYQPLLSATPVITAPSTTTPAPVKTVTRQVVYIPISGQGQTLSTSWTDLPGTDFYLNTADYTGFKQAYFESSLKLQNGNGLAFARLFDLTHGIEVWGSETQAGGQKGALAVSSLLTLRPGNNLYRVQLKSLTADTAIFASGRLKIVIEK
jgi:hypothetical protein